MSKWWAVEWRSRNRLDGETRRLQWTHPPRLFRTRSEARAHIEGHYGYIRTRPDLQAQPFGWRMPQAVRVSVQVVS